MSTTVVTTTMNSAPATTAQTERFMGPPLPADATPPGGLPMPLVRRLVERMIPDMTKAGKTVLANALRLSESERAELAAEVLASLDGPADADAEAAWEREIRRRIAAIEAGAIELEPWEA